MLEMGAQWCPKDKTFLITGGASGLGALYAERFLKEEAKSIAILDVAVDKGQELAANLNKIYSDKIIFYQCDVSDETQVAEVFNQVVNKFGQVDVIINNAGIMVDSPTVWRRACNLNWQGLVSLTLKGVEHMRKDEGGAGGTIINVSSTLSIVKMPFLPIYAGSKAAVLHFSQSLAMNPFHEQTGIRILIFCLDATNTELLENLQNKAWDKNMGETFANFALTVEKQKPESAADVLVKMFKEGNNGSIWLSHSDKPGEDITQTINSAYDSYASLLPQQNVLQMLL